MIEKLARDIYAEFKAKPESQHIAKEFALVELSKLIERIKPRHVLEIGAGIGTITKLLMTHPDRPERLTVTEAHPVCLRELEQNLKGLSRAGFLLVQAASELDISADYDLVIFDGTLDGEQQYAVFKLGTWCFVEGSRGRTIEQLKLNLQRRHLTINIEQHRPGGNKLKFLSARRVFGMRLPAIKVKPIKGCSIGQVIALN
jgi:hypothetical protein